MNPRISVIIPAYQHGATLAACLDSVLGQTLAPSEVIVVNDGSTDNTREVLERYAGRVTAIHQENQGGNPARNQGFQASSGDFVLFCDADLVMRQDMLKLLYDALRANSEASYAYSGFKFGWKTFRSFPFDPDRLRKMNFIHTSALIRREAFPGFDPEIRRLQDWDVWLTMLENGHHGVLVDEELFRVQEDRDRRGISQWRPSIMYRIPWGRLGWMPRSMRKYQESRKILALKHGL